MSSLCKIGGFVRYLHSSINNMFTLISITTIRMPKLHTKWSRDKRMYPNNNQILDTNAITMSGLIISKHLTIPIQQKNYESTC